MTLLLGYDRRELWVDLGGLWPAQRRGLYLLDEEARKPLSVDVIVWPTVYRTPALDALAAEIGDATLGVRGAPRPDFVGPYQDLWGDLDDLLRHRGPADLPSDVIAVAGTDHPMKRHLPVLATSPAARWPLLGYDVADEYLLSGLANCGYEPDEKQTLAAKYCGSLNEHHLFIDEQAARSFARACDSRVPEHAPFFVFELRRMPAEA